MRLLILGGWLVIGLGLTSLSLSGTTSSLPVVAQSGVTAGCTGLQLTPNTSVGGFISEEYRWSDRACQLRTAALVHHDTQDPSGNWGGYLRRYSYVVDGTTRTALGSFNEHPGFGYTTNHFGTDGGNAFLSHTKAGTYRTVFQGSHHAIHEFKTSLPLGGGNVDATIQWFFATGRDHPVWSVTFDSTPAGPNVVSADTRAPYGDIQWDGGADAPVAGVGWGDHYRFSTVSTPFNFDSRWDYSVPNTVPYNVEWSTTPDAEMGLVQTQTYTQHDAGGYWAYGLWGKNSESPNLPADVLQPGGKMPADFNWPYQLNQYEIPFQNPVTSKRLAWGANFGAVGQTQYPALGDDHMLSGYPYQSYSVFVVLGKHSAAAVNAQVTEIEIVQRTTLTARTGTVLRSGPAGIARPDTITYQPVGYNQIDSTWELTAGPQNTLDADLTVGAGTLQNPVFVLHNYTAATVPATMLVNGVPAVRDVDFFPSLDTANQTLWLTLNRTVGGTTNLQLGASAPTPTTTPGSGAAEHVYLPFVQR